MFSEAEIQQIYNTRTKKDMPFQEFRKQVKALTDPVGIQRDVGQILAGRDQQRRIDFALKHKRNRDL